MSIHQAKKLYRPERNFTIHPRKVEYEALAIITRGLKTHQNQNPDFPNFCNAVYKNRQIWREFKNDVLSNNNGHNIETRERITYLSNIIEKNSAAALRNPAKAKILIEINLIIMKGLQQ